MERFATRFSGESGGGESAVRFGCRHARDFRRPAASDLHGRQTVAADYILKKSPRRRFTWHFSFRALFGGRCGSSARFYLLYAVFLLFAMEETDGCTYTCITLAVDSCAQNAQGVVNCKTDRSFRTGAGLSLTLLVRLLLGMRSGLRLLIAPGGLARRFPGKLVPPGFWFGGARWFPRIRLSTDFASGACLVMDTSAASIKNRHRRFLTPADPDETAVTG
jgi:hypothetical protein